MTPAIESALRTFRIEYDAIKSLEDKLDNNFDYIARLILECNGKIVVTGIGKSGIIGIKIAATLASTGTPAFFVHPGEALHGDLGMIETKDIILVLSNSGETDEVLKLIPFFKENLNIIISMTSKPDSTLAQNSNFHINVSVEKEACPLSLAPTSSTTAVLVMGDALAISVMEMRGFHKENFAKFHPGGSLGRRLLTKAKDVMQSDNLPIISPKTAMIDIIHTISNGRKGLAIICEMGEIKGIITDGDMRRVFESNGERAFNLKANEIMTKRPKCISEDLHLEHVQKLMISHKINTLLVTADGELKNLIGVIQVYDIE